MIQSHLHDLVVANRILANEGVVDAFGHVSIRSPDNPNRYFQSRSRAPELVTADDLMEFNLAGDAVDLQGRALREEVARGLLEELLVLGKVEIHALGSPWRRLAGPG